MQKFPAATIPGLFYCFLVFYPPLGVCESVEKGTGTNGPGWGDGGSLSVVALCCVGPGAEGELTVGALAG